MSIMAATQKPKPNKTGAVTIALYSNKKRLDELSNVFSVSSTALARALIEHGLDLIEAREIGIEKMKIIKIK